MARFRFVGVTSANERQEGVLEAVAVADAAAVLRKRGLFVVRVEPETQRRSLWATLNRDVTLSSPIPRRELVTLTLEWAGLLEAGVSLDEALGLSASNARSKPALKIVRAIREAVKGGSSLNEALRAHPRCFPPVYVALTQAGEAAGELGQALKRLAADLEAGQDFSEKIKGALLYPAFLVVTASGAIVVLLTVVVPNLESLVTESGAETLPFTTKAVIGASHFLKDFGLIGMAAFALVIALVALAARTPATRRKLDRMALRLPVAGELIRSANAGRYLRTLSALVGGGVALPRALPLAAPALSNRALAADVEVAHGKVLVGSALGDALAASRALPDDALALARTGERTGRLSDALGKAASLLETRVRRRLQAIATLIGPMLTVGFGLVAGVIVYAMLSTILGVNELAYQ
ncbi:type II secretion system F family protein [Methylopila sp. M107]|uniref:type II secretion system F family protein n=1 Tax=Methylopila sp. M107 TaxID=1101190 RepID=UPI0003818668|nr:type II secretion system F family protein [Methylopila sp. M107]